MTPARALLAIVVVLLSISAPAAASEQHPTSAELESEIICPVCDTTLDTSNAEIARRMKLYIRQRIEAGDTKSEIKGKLVAQFGEQILAVPRRRGFNWIAWLLPLAGLAVAVPSLAVLAWRWSTSRPPDDPPALDPELERRLDSELARFE